VKKILRWAFLLLGFLTVLVALATGIAWYYKPEITQAVHRKLNEKINGEFDIKDIGISVLEDFPNVSITLRDVYLRGAQYERYKKDFFRAQKLQLNVHLGKLLVKEIDVKSVKIVHGQVFIFRTRLGYTNLDVFKAYHPGQRDTTAQHSSASLSVEELDFDDVALFFSDSLKEKAFGVNLSGRNIIHRKDSTLEFRYTGKMNFDRLQFNTRKGSYLLGKTVEARLDVDYDRRAHRLTVLPSTLKLDRSHLELTGSFVFTPAGSFEFGINSNDMHYEEGLSVLPELLAGKLKRYNIHAPFAVNVKVGGSLAPGSQPTVDIQFQVHDAAVTVGKYRAEKVSTKGSYTNHRDDHKSFDDENSVVHIASFTGIFDRLPMTGEGTFINLSDPIADLKVSVEGDAGLLQHELDSTRYRIEGGRIHVQLAYLGKLTEYLDPAKSRFGGTLIGKTELQKVKLVWVARQTTLEDVQASIDFTQNQFHIGNLSLKYNGSPVVIKGSIVGFVPFFSVPRQKGTIKLEVTSPSLNMTPVAVKVSKQSVKKNAGPTGKKVISDLIDNLYSKLEFELLVNIAQLRYRNFTARDLTGTLMMTNNQLQAKAVRMQLAGGTVQVAVGLSDLNRSVNPISVQAVVQQADIHDFFYVFNNFNQKMVGYQNLSGKINAKVTLKAKIDDNLDVLMSSLRGKVDLTVRKGKLKNFAPMEKLSSFFENRDFTDIDFAEINSTFDLRGTELTISRMEVQSSVVSLFLEGRYSLADSTDLSIQLPLSNLKTRDKTYKPRNVGIDASVGPSVFLRARRDEHGTMTITYDMFKKFRKKKGAK
jgi:hypothetical protein